jgi:hypothetical protein
MRTPLLAVLILLGSALRAGDPVREFRDANPAISSSYYYFAVTSPESEIDHANEALQQLISAVLVAVGSTSIEHLPDSKVKALVQRRIQITKGEIDGWRTIRSQMVEGDVLAYFQWKEGLRTKAGHLILNAGRIRKEWIISEGADFLSAEESRANQRSEGTSAESPPSNPSQGAAVPHP